MKIVVIYMIMRLIYESRNRWLSGCSRTSDVVAYDNDYHSQIVNPAPVLLTAFKSLHIINLMRSYFGKMW